MFRGRTLRLLRRHQSARRRVARICGACCFSRLRAVSAVSLSPLYRCGRPLSDALVPWHRAGHRRPSPVQRRRHRGFPVAVTMGRRACAAGCKSFSRSAERAGGAMRAGRRPRRLRTHFISFSMRRSCPASSRACARCSRTASSRASARCSRHHHRHVAKLTLDRAPQLLRHDRQRPHSSFHARSSLRAGAPRVPHPALDATDLGGSLERRRRPPVPSKPHLPAPPPARAVA